MKRTPKTPAFVTPGAASVAGPSTGLSAEAEKLAGAALSPATVRSYRSALAALDAWLADQGRGADDLAVADYLAWRHEAGHAPATISITLAALKCVARLTGSECPAGSESARVMAGIRRTGRDRGRGQVKGLQWNHADTVAAVAANGGGRRAGLRDAALVSLMSDCLLRISEAVAVQVADLAIEPDGSGRLTLRHSKTDQDGAGAVLYVGASTMARIATWIEAAEIESGPLFRRIRRGGHVQEEAVTDRAGRQIIKARASDCGIEGASGHSLRVGAAQSLATAGASLVEMQQSGRWTSPAMPARYARGELAGRGAVARLRHGKG